MTVLPSQKLSIGEMCVSFAAGLMLFLLPNDAKNQFHTEMVCEGFVFIVSVIITVCLHLIIKRFEAVGAMMLTMSSIIASAIVITSAANFINKGIGYWPSLSRYNVICMSIMWAVPFLYVVFVRLLSGKSNNHSDVRRSFARFLYLSMRSMMIIYIIAVFFRLIIPMRPQMDLDRYLLPMPFQMVSRCITGEQPKGLEYMIWNCIILAPLTFYISVLVPKFRVWHALIISVALGLTLEMLQFILNTGLVCTDDVIMYILGAILGVVLKAVIDLLRRFVTMGRETTVLTYDYRSPRRSSGEAEIIEEE